MFKPLPALAGVPAGFVYETSSAPGTSSSVPSRITAMLPGGVRGRGFGRGVPAGGPPPAVPGTHVPQNAPDPDSSDPAPQPSAAPAVSGGAPGNLPPDFLDYIEVMGQNIGYLREQLSEMRGEVSAIHNRGADSQRVFDALHTELNDYKRDFIFQHIKPLLRPLLYLYDSLEGFDKEMKLYEDAQAGQDLPPDALKGSKVRQNITFMRDQLVEALQVCEVEPMSMPSGTFDARSQKAIDTVPVARELDGTIVDVIRIGWTMNNQLLRPAEVILGKAKPEGSASVGFPSQGFPTDGSSV